MEFVLHVQATASAAPQLQFAKIAKKDTPLTAPKLVLPVRPPISLLLSAHQVLPLFVRLVAHLVFPLSSAPHVSAAMHYHHLYVSLAINLVQLVLPINLQSASPASLVSVYTQAHVFNAPIATVWSVTTTISSVPNVNQDIHPSMDNVKHVRLIAITVIPTERAYAM